MNKTMREILNKIENKKKEANDFLAKAKASTNLEEKKDLKAKASKAFDELEELKADYELEKRAYEAEKESVSVEETPKVDNKLQLKAFAKYLAKRPLTDTEFKALSSLSGPDGGYLIPQDIQTRINELQRQYVSLRSLITVQSVNTVEGSRVIETDAAHTPFVDIDELTDIPSINGPQFNRLTYKIRDLGGILTIPNHLLNDETGGLVNYLAEWFVKKQYATDNDMILNADGSKGSQGIFGVPEAEGGFYKETLSSTLTFRKARSILNKGFPMPIAKNAIILTNQDGLDILDNMQDSNERNYLTGDGTEEFPYRFKGRRVVVYDNDVIPNYNDGTNDLAPFIFGDLKSALVLFDRQQMEIASSKEAGFIQNATLMRAIIRQDTRIWDQKAVKVYYSPLLA